MMPRPYRLLVLIAALAALLALPAGALAASPLTLTQLPGVHYPNQLYLLSSNRSLQAPASQVKVTENGQPVQSLSVRAAGTVGSSDFGAVLLIDSSNSMGGPGTATAVAAAQKFLAARAPSQPDGIVYFNSSTSVAAPMTTNSATLNHALDTPPAPHEGTHLFDAAATALSMLHNSGVASGLIVLLSDGRDTGSHESEAALGSAAAAAGVRIYSIGVQDGAFDGSTLQDLANTTNGLYQPSNSPQLVSLFQRLGAEPANNYTLSYKSSVPVGHAVTVNVSVPGVGTATAGYTASSTQPVAAPLPTQVPVPVNSSFFASTAGAIVTSLVVGLLIGLAAMLAFGRRGDLARRVRGYVSPDLRAPGDPRSIVERALGDKNARRIVKSPFLTRLAVEIEVAELNMTVEQLIGVGVIFTLLVGWLLVLETGSAFAAPLAIAVPFAMYTGVRWRAERKRRIFSEQLPDNLQVIASAMRAGTTFVGALKTVVEDAPEPSQRELKRAITDEALGIPLADSLNQVTVRMNSEDFGHVTIVAALQRDTGGNTAEVIDLVADTIRERIEIRRMVRGLTAQGRLAGLVLSFLPVGLLLIISLINPSYTHPLFHTTTGLIATGVGVTLSVVGSLIIRKIVNIKI
jgi:Flp pilus assembly protein TadB/Mg-chelatase subunit ChlD